MYSVIEFKRQDQLDCRCLLTHSDRLLPQFNLITSFHNSDAKGVTLLGLSYDKLRLKFEPKIHFLVTMVVQGNDEVGKSLVCRKQFCKKNREINNGKYI